MDHREQLPVGTELVDEFRIDGVLGLGGFGITYVATDLRLNARVAIKEYFPAEFAVRDTSYSIRARSEKLTEMFEWGRSRFLQEAQTLAALRHPNIVRVSRIFEACNTIFMVLDYEDGKSLGASLKALGHRPTQSELDDVATPILDALSSVHAQGVLHRDIAPDNIFIRDDNTPVLLDFGSARHAIAEETGTLTGIVKPGYSPPEQYSVAANLQGPWTDIYAFAATLYHAITGEMLQDSPGRQLDDSQQPLQHGQIEGYRAGCLGAINQALKLKISERPQTVGEFQDRYLANDERTHGRPTQAPGLSSLAEFNASLLARTTKPQRAAAIGLVIVALTVAVGYAIIANERAAEQAQRLVDQTAKKARLLRQAEHAREAQQRAEERRAADERAWRKATAENTREAFEHYLAMSPEGSYAREARMRIEKIIADERRRNACKGLRIAVGTAETAAQTCIQPGSGKQFRDCPTCPELVIIPAGSMQMGSPRNEPQRSKDEGPRHRVTIGEPLAVGVHEVTRRQYEEFVQASGHVMGQSCYAFNARGKLVRTKGVTFQSPGFAQAGDHPVVCVSWQDAKAYTQWLSRKTGHSYRLLSEAEWEFAARAGTDSPFWWGASISPHQALYNATRTYGGGQKGVMPETTVPVETYKANPWGLYNVHGNVAEWAEDCYHASYRNAPTDGAARGARRCKDRVLRGGSGAHFPHSLRSASRDFARQASPYQIVGFRVARSLR